GFGTPFLIRLQPVTPPAGVERTARPGKGPPGPGPERPKAHETAASPMRAPSPGNAVGPIEPARRYGQLDRAACEAELERRGGAFTRVREARGVTQPLRLTGPLHGVTFHSAVPPSQRASSPWEIVDCRLALALDDFAAQLATHGVVEVVHDSIYRPPAAEWPAEQAGTQHVGALAIDVASFTKKDGSKLDVERDFHGGIGAVPCGPGATAPTVPTAEAVELRQIVCDAAEAKLFQVALTPDYNRDHYNHFHLEVNPGVQWFLLR
ncbi:MAG: extensin family protein, partial [Myxococcales bacterium]|nr:extensin family protein [Myxococcales bacterium]